MFGRAARRGPWGRGVPAPRGPPPPPPPWGPRPPVEAPVAEGPGEKFGEGDGWIGWGNTQNYAQSPNMRRTKQTYSTKVATKVY